MFICYSDDKSAGKSPVPYEVWKATDNYLQHYNNMMLLDFLATNSKDGVERAQARKELELAQKKMEFWKHHPNYDQERVTAGVLKIKRQWNK